jgi:hypothetical protein
MVLRALMQALAQVRTLPTYTLLQERVQRLAHVAPHVLPVNDRICFFLNVYNVLWCAPSRLACDTCARPDLHTHTRWRGGGVGHSLHAAIEHGHPGARSIRLGTFHHRVRVLGQGLWSGAP